jgi:hypothetical protein
MVRQNGAEELARHAGHGVARAGVAFAKLIEFLRLVEGDVRR